MQLSSPPNHFSGPPSCPVVRSRLLQALLVLLGALCSIAIAGSATASMPLHRTVVSITFDDGRASQWSAGTALSSRGIRGTFYVNSSSLGTAGYLTWEQAALLATAGHEIGGHTLTHRDLRTLTSDEVRNEICDDRDAIVAHGFAATSFAYPFGFSNSSIEAIAEQCGYASARITVGIAGSVGWCTAATCPAAETLPPWNPWAVRVTGSVKTSTTLEQLKSFVTQAEENGGGWVPFVFHDVGTDDEYSISTADFEGFLDWLAPRRSRGTVVRTIDEVSSGIVDPPPAANLVQNPSFEIDADLDSMPDCWEATGWGDNVSAWSKVESAEAPTGTMVARGTIDAWTSGQRQLLSRRSAGCAPAAVPGLRYRITGWYRGTLSPVISVFWDNGSGSWSTGAGSPDLPASASWKLASWTTPPAPPGAVQLAIGMAVGGAPGTVEIDDLKAGDAFGTSPAVEIYSLGSNGFASGDAYPLSAGASDDDGIESVEFYVDDVYVGTDTTGPFSLDWNSTAVADGPYALTVLAADVDGALSSQSLPFSVDNTPPGATLTAPVRGSYLRGAVMLAAASADAGSGVSAVEFESSPAGQGRWSPVGSEIWSTSEVADGSYNLRARATDLAGNVSTSPAVPVVVDNTSPTVSLLRPAAGSLRRRNVTLLASPEDATSGLESVVFEIASAGTAGWREASVLEQAPWEASLSFPKGSHGVFHIRATAFDRAGHSFTSPEREFRVDNIAPTSTFACNRESCRRPFVNAVWISIRARDRGSKVASIRYTTDGSPPTRSSRRYMSRFLLRATKLVRWRVWDAAGNASRVRSQRVHVR